MPLLDLSSVQISATVAIICLVSALLLLILVARHSDVANIDKPPSLFKRLLSGETLSEIGLRYRIGVFIALMFAFMNTIGTVVIFLASQTQP
jgi:hypothetical protein